MRKIHYLVGIMLLMAGYSTNVCAQVSNDNEDGVYKVERSQSHDYVPGEVLFKLKDGQQARMRRSASGVQSAGISSLDAVLKEYGVKEMEQLLPNAKIKGTPRRAKAYNGETIVERDLTQLYQVKLPEEKAMETMQMVEELKKLDEVEFAEPNYKVYMMDSEIAANYSGNPFANSTYQWYLTSYGVNQLWNKSIINPERPVIAILDTGVDITHPDLSPNIWTNTAEAEGEANYDNDGNGFPSDVHGWDFINNSPNIRDNNMHGTHVAGIAAAANNGIGIVGANPMAYIMPVTVMQSDGTGDVATIIQGINYAVANGATVLNLSLGTYANSNAMRQALANAYGSAVIVAAAGNDGKCINITHEQHQIKPAPSFPAAYSFVLGVQATTSTGSLASFSNYDDNGPSTSDVTTFRDPDGFNYELKAPGSNMLSTVPGGNYKALNGTSMAAPLVAGAISALKMVKQYDTQEILWGDLIHTADIAAAYAVANRPAELDLMSIQYRERKELSSLTEEDYSNDGEIDAGETVSLYPVIRTTFGAASNIQMYLALGDQYEDPSVVNIISDSEHKVNFGLPLSAYGKGVSLNPLQVRIADNVADNRHIKMKVVVTCHETNTIYEGLFTLVVNNMKKISGLISQDSTLTADHIYFVDDNLGILENVTLTIEPGTRLEFGNGVGISSLGKIIAHGTPAKPIIFTGHNGAIWERISSKKLYSDTLSYCRLEQYQPYNSDRTPYVKNCVISPAINNYTRYVFSSKGERNNITWGNRYVEWTILSSRPQLHSNIINNFYYCPDIGFGGGYLPKYSVLGFNNYVNCSATSTYSEGNYYGKKFVLGIYSSSPSIDSSDTPTYLGTSREDLVRPYIFEMGNGTGYGQINISNMATSPYAEAHGIVWKVLVNDKDAQDEYEDLAPLGVGKHKFEVYFNRPMNKEVAPNISFGVRDPWTQNVVNEDGAWNEEGTIYTAYKTITGKTKSDGVNRIYVYGAQDDEFFEIPYEKTRFNVMINAAGSMATGFAGEAGMGRVNLTWDNTNNNFEDAMGFNIYRYTIDSNNNADTTRINTEIVDIETTAYTDYDVTPGETYYYMYKVLSTDLKEYDVSNVVAVTPLTATQGDANGSGAVDVADVISTVNYAAGLEPKPFIFEAADMNDDNAIDILDVIGIIQTILNPTAAPALALASTATYTIEDGTLYVESPVDLAGVQVQLNMDEKRDITVAEALNGFEHVTAWLTDNDMLFMAYNMNGKKLTAGKHALLKIGDAVISSIRLSDAYGHNVEAVADNTTAIDAMGSKVLNQSGVYNLNGQKVAGKAETLNKLPKGVYIINGEKIVK